MPMNTTERARIAGRAAQSALTFEERKARMATVRLAGHVTALCRHWDDLTEEQRARIKALACS